MEQTEVSVRKVQGAAGESNKKPKHGKGYQHN